MRLGNVILLYHSLRKETILIFGSKLQSAKKYNGEELHYGEKSGVVLFVHDGNVFIH